MAIDHHLHLEELIPGFPEDIALECLARSHYSTHHLAASVCRRWHHLFHSSDFNLLRRQTGQTRLAACLVQAIPPATPGPGSDVKPASSGPPAFGISLFDSVSRTWERVQSYPKYPDRLPLFCHITSSQGKLILMGGWDPDTYDPVTDVFIYDFRTRKWSRGRDMPGKRSLFAIGAVDGQVLIAGGHDGAKNALDTAWAYRIDSDEWIELIRMSESRDECSGLMIGPEFWVVSGYDTENQGLFKQSSDVYDTTTGQWRRVEDAWGTCQSPRACVGVRRDGGLFSWADMGPEARVSTCTVDLGDRALVSGSDRHGSPCGLYMVERVGNGEYGEMKRLEVPDQFKGFVQSACCVEI